MQVKRAVLFTFILAVAMIGWGCAAPTAKLKVSRNEINQGDPVTVSWETKNAKTIDLNGKTVNAIGSETITPNQTTDYNLVAHRGKKEAKDNANVKVDVTNVVGPTITLNATPNDIEKGQTTTLEWSTEHAKTVNITGLGEVASSGRRTVSPSSSTTYTGTAHGDGGNATASTRVTVNTPVTNTIRNTPRNEPNFAKEFNDAVAIVYFDYDKAELKPEAQARLRRAAQWLLQDSHRTIDFRIEGNCDPRGTAEYNLGLGDRRARAAKEFLASLGVDASRIGTVSYGIEKAQGKSEGSEDQVPSWAHDRHDNFVYTGGGNKQ